MITYPDSFDGQFLIGSETLPHRPDARAHRLETLHLQTIGALPVLKVSDRDGRLLGVLLGYPVDYRKGAVLTGDVRLDEALESAEGVEAFVERHVYGYGGSFVFVLDCHGLRRVYLDAGGSLSLVYDPERRICAATSGLILDPSAYSARFNRKLYEFLDIPRDGWFPAGLTAHQGISRLLCNHYLDLSDWGAYRHWPPGQIAITDDPDLACQRIIKSIAATIAALRGAGPTGIALTAGSETRLILAACREQVSDLEFITVSGSQLQLDMTRAQELARRFGLRHTLLPEERASNAEAEQWHARASHSIGGANMHNFPTIAPLARLSYFAGGVAGETGRGFFWRPNDEADTRISAHDLAARFGMPVHPQVVAAIDQWMHSLPAVDTFLKLDLAYLELRVACWAFAQAYSTPHVKHIHPLISREAFTAMLSLPPEWRRSNRMITRGIELAWPELLDMPINRYGDHRDYTRLVGRALRNPHLIVRKLRKRFG